MDKLLKGMYVCALDRPWLSTPFPFQGFVIRGDDDIAELRKYCAYVYIDVLRGVPPEADGGLARSWKPGKTEEPESLTKTGTTGITATAKPDAPEETSTVYARGPEESIEALPIRTNPDYYQDPKNFRRELKRAQQIHTDLTRATGQIIDDIRVGRGLDLTAVRSSVNSMIGSVIRHPDAFVWMTKLRNKDSYSYGHSVRCSVFSIVMARHMGLAENQLEKLAMGSLLCNVGKAKLPRRLLNQRDPLSNEDISLLHSQIDLGVEILDRCVGINDDVIEVVANHHERFDGSGYPTGKIGDQIPLLARFAGLVDCYDAMVSIKPYTDEVMSTSEAMDFLYDQRNVLFQGQLIEEFIQAMGIYPTGTLVELNTGEVALIQAQNVRNRIQPEILMVMDQRKNIIEKFNLVDMRKHNSKNEARPLSIKRALTAGEFGLDPNKIMEVHASQKWDWRKLAFS
jgi:HD-GYP domain-containing protein (c-di-GMP phosphodiesterase class II)